MKTSKLIAALALSLFGATAAAQNAGPSFFVAPKVGVFKSTTDLPFSFYAAAEVGVVTPLLDRRLALVVEGSWHRPVLVGDLTEAQLSGGSGGFGMAERQVAVMLSAVYRMPVGPPGLTLYGGAGPGAYHHHVRTTAFGSTHIETQLTFGAQALVGGEYKLGPGGLFAEAHYHFTQIDFLTTGPATVGGFLALSAGYRLLF